MRPETDLFNQRLISLVYQAIELWEHWAENVPAGYVKVFHTSAIRLTKGIVKAWRVLLAEIRSDAQRTPNSQ